MATRVVYALIVIQALLACGGQSNNLRVPFLGGKDQDSKRVDPGPTPSASPSPELPACNEQANAATFARGDGSAESPFGICTLAQLLHVADFTADHFELLADVDFAGNPDDFYLHELSGTFDGTGHKIANYT